MTATDLTDEIYKEIQGIFRKTPVLLVGSGFSCGYGLPGMGALANHLATSLQGVLSGDGAKNAWAQSVEAIKKNLEAGLKTIPPGAAEWEEILPAIRIETAKLILEKTIAAESQILKTKYPCNLAPSRLLNRLFTGSGQNVDSIHVITTNYDTLLELFCDLAEVPLDTGFTGFRRRKPRSHPLFQAQYMRVKFSEKHKEKIEHRPCKTVRLYKPHGSICWQTTNDETIEVLNSDSAVGRAIIVPGPSKYQDSLINTLFDEMRAEMNEVLVQAQAMFCIGFGFNDDHLQGIIKRRLTEGMPVIIATQDPTPSIEQLLQDHSHVIAFFKYNNGTICHWNGNTMQSSEPIWQLDDFLKKFLE